jgi:hypothetical protein
MLCLEQAMGKPEFHQSDRLETLKRKLSELNLCGLTHIPHKMQHCYNNKIIKKVLFQYINKSSYNPSLLEILIRRNSVLKFALSLVSKAVLYKRGVISSYDDSVAHHVEMRSCGEELGLPNAFRIK